MEYFIVTLIYELLDVVEYPVYRDYIVNTNDQIIIAEFLQSPKYQIEGYRVAGLFSLFPIAKTTAESLLALQKDTPPPYSWAISYVKGRHGSMNETL